MNQVVTIRIEDFEKYLEDWVELCSDVTNHQSSGIKSRRIDLVLCLQYLRENHITQITPSHLMDFLKHARLVRENSPATANRKRASLRVYIRHLRLRGVPGAMAFAVEAIPTFRMPYQGQIFNLELPEVLRLLDSIDVSSLHGCRDRVIYTILYKSALRIGEIVAIDLADVDLEEKCITIHGKGRKERTLPMDEEMVKLISEWLILRQAYPGAKRTDALFISQKGRRLAIRTIQDNFKKLVDQLKPFSLDQVTPHSLRHAFASHSLETDASDRQLVILKHYLGHSLFKSTLIYARPSLRVLREAMSHHIASEIVADISWLKRVPMRARQQRRKVA